MFAEGSHCAYLRRRRELIEDVVVPLLRRLGGDSGLLEQIVLNETSLDLELGVETDLHETSETRRVVVANCLRITCNQIMSIEIYIF